MRTSVAEPGRNGIVLAAATMWPFARAVAVRVMGRLRNARVPEALSFSVMPLRRIRVRDWRRAVVRRTCGDGGGGSSERKEGVKRPVLGPAIIACGEGDPWLRG